MINRHVLKTFALGVFIFLAAGKGNTQIPDYDVGLTSLGGVLSYYSESPSGFLANPANLGLNSWQRATIHLNAPYRFNAIVLNGFRPQIGHMGLAFTNGLGDVPAQSFRAGFSKLLGHRGTWGLRLDYSKFGENKRLFMNWGGTYRFVKINRSGAPIKMGFGAHISHINILNQIKEPVQWGAGGFISLKQDQLKFYPNVYVQNKRAFWSFGIRFNLIEDVSVLASFSDRSGNRVFGGISFNLNRYLADIGFNPDEKRLQISFSMLFGESPEERAQKYFNDGKHALEQHDYEEARRDFHRAWCYVPENNFYNRSFELVTRKIRNEEKQIQKWMSDAQELEQRGYFFVAAMRYLDILNQNPDYKPAQYRLKALRPLVRNDIKRTLQKGKHYLDQGQESIAEKIFQKILLIDKNNKEARQLLTKIKSSKHKEAEEYFYRGLGYYSQRKLGHAQEQFEKALLIDPGYEEVKVYLDEIQRKNDRKLAKIDSLLNKAGEFEKRKSFSRALDIYLHVLDIAPTNEAAQKGVSRLNRFVKKRDSFYLKKSQAALRKKDFKTAERYVNRILRISPKNRKAVRLKNKINQAKITLFNELVDRGDAELQAHHLKNALRNYQMAASIFPRSPKIKQTIEHLTNQIELEKNLNAGIAAFNGQRYVQAIHYFEKVLDGEPSNEKAASYLKTSKE
ncbi:MAG: tetratricopeptide repeat protein, partial [Calditrichaeota bacterium]|nr:tetratricopeptide repeat protein [Calditrichota bacterium]